MDLIWPQLFPDIAILDPPIYGAEASLSARAPAGQTPGDKNLPARSMTFTRMRRFSAPRFFWQKWTAGRPFASTLKGEVISNRKDWGASGNTSQVRRLLQFRRQSS